MAELQRLGAVPSLAAPAEAELRRLRTRAEEMRGQAEAADGSSTRVELARAGYDLRAATGYLGASAGSRVRWPGE